MKNKKGQTWGIDIIVAVCIFSVGILIFLIYTLNYTYESGTNLENMGYDGEMMFNDILSEGYPPDYNSGNVIKIGILNQGKINQSKLDIFYNLSISDYQKTKILFKSRFDYMLFIDNITAYGNPIVGVGKPGANITSYKNLIKLTRLNIYKNKPVNVYLYIFENE